MNAWMAWRFTLRGTDRGRFSPLTLFAWIAIALGTAAMTSLISVMFGFESSLKSRVLSAQPHVVIHAVDRSPIPDPDRWTFALRGVPHVSRVVPYLETEMIVNHGGKSLGAVVWGMPRDAFGRLQAGVERGSLPNYDARESEALLAVELSHRLGANAGSDLEVASPLSVPGSLAPAISHFRVSGIYASGHYEFDQSHLFVFLEDAQDLLRLGTSIHGWQIWADDTRHARRIQHDIRALVGGAFLVESWEDLNSALFQSLKLEQLAMLSILSLAILVAVLNVGITLAMHVTYKRRNIGVLRALGASARMIQRLFLWQGAWLGLVGMAAGGLLTSLFYLYVKYLTAYQLPDIYYDRDLPIEVRLFPTLTIFVSASFLIFFSTIIPARSAARLDPVEAIRE